MSDRGKDTVTGNEIRFNKHRKRKNNFIVSAMYAMYQTGKSLEDIGKVYGKTRQAVYDIFRSRGYPLRTKKMEGLQILDGHKFSFTKEKYLRGTVNGKRVMMHYYVWEKANGAVPDRYVIFHKDRNRENNALENLELVHKSLMGKIFNHLGKNQHGNQKEQITIL